MHPLAGKVAIITGASSGIGESTARMLADRGARVALVARRRDRLDALAASLPGAAAFPCDVADPAAVNAMAADAQRRLGPPDILVNNAGVMYLADMAKCRADEWKKMIDINITGVLNCLAAVLPAMTRRASGHIVNVSSVAGRRTFPGAAVYCGTKFFVHGLSEALRAELSRHNIRVTIIAPGLVRTELQSHTTDPDVLERWKKRPEFEWLEADDVAREIVSALERPARVGVNEVLIRPTAQES